MVDTKAATGHMTDQSMSAIGTSSHRRRALPAQIVTTSMCLALMLGALVLLALDGCTTLPNGRNWGQDSSFARGWQRLSDAASDAARSPRVWLPVAGAALFQIDNWDRETSDWARENTPIFGSQQNASDWSDKLNTGSDVAYLVTVAATPSGDSAGEWLSAKAKGLAVGLAAIATTSATTSMLKSAVGRERPNGENDASFPSGHTSHAAVLAQLAERNLRSVEIHDGTRRALDFSFDALTIGTAWARVEAGAHYPSDVLFSMALGNFFGMVFNDAFLGLDEQSHVSLALTWLPNGGATLNWQIRF